MFNIIIGSSGSNSDYNTIVVPIDALVEISADILSDVCFVHHNFLDDLFVGTNSF